MSACPSFTLIVVAYHRPHSLAQLLGRLEASDDLTVVVANVEDDRDVSKVGRAHGAEMVTVPGNPGYAAAINLAVAAVTTDYVVFSNDDLLTTRADLETLVRAVADETCDIAVPKITNSAGTPERTIAALPTPGALIKEWLLLPDRPVPSLRWLKVEKWRLPVMTEPVDAAMGAISALRTQLLQSVPLPEQYFLYWEEHDWFWQLRARGFRVSYCPEAVAVHDGSREVRPERSRLLARNAVRCVRSTQGRQAAALAFPIIVLWNVRLVAVDAFRSAAGHTTPGRLQSRRDGLRAALAAWREVR